MKEVRKLQRVQVYSPNPEHRAIFVERARRELGLEAEAAESARAAVSGADLVVAATNTSQPIVDGSWIAPGAHVGVQEQCRNEAAVRGSCAANLRACEDGRNRPGTPGRMVPRRHEALGP